MEANSLVSIAGFFLINRFNCLLVNKLRCLFFFFFIKQELILQKMSVLWTKKRKWTPTMTTVRVPFGISYKTRIEAAELYSPVCNCWRVQTGIDHSNFPKSLKVFLRSNSYKSRVLCEMGEMGVEICPKIGFQHPLPYN